jgi:hypothetical protein
MFSPEFLNEERGEFFLVAIHGQACPESIQFSRLGCATINEVDFKKSLAKH